MSATTPEDVDAIMSRVSADVDSGDFLVKARVNGMTSINSIVVSQEPNKLLLEESAATSLPPAARVTLLFTLITSHIIVEW